MDTQAPDTPDTEPDAPVVCEMSNDDYHEAKGISKTGLWTIDTKSPGHYRYGEPKTSPAFAMGGATHHAILEPHLFEEKYVRGPDARRNSNEWKDADKAAIDHGQVLLKPDDYDCALEARDSVLKNPIVRQFVETAVIERAGFWTDPETGARCKTKPDAYSAKLGIIGDLKTSRDAGYGGFSRAIYEYGYHVQDWFYSEGWRQCGHTVDSFVFFVVEPVKPFPVAIYELAPSARKAGEEIGRRALRRYADCLRTDTWPTYPHTVQEIDLPPWGYRGIGEAETTEE